MERPTPPRGSGYQPLPSIRTARTPTAQSCLGNVWMFACMYVCMTLYVCMYTMMYNPSSRCSPFPRANSVTGRGVETQCRGGWGRPGREAKNKKNKLSPGAWKNRGPKNGCESTAGKGAEFCCRIFVVSNSYFVSERIKNYWNQKSIVINPGIDFNNFNV